MQKSVKYVLLFEFSIIVLMYIARIFCTLTTGFILPDEALYYYRIFQYLKEGGYFWISYSSRYLYQFLMLFLSIIFRADTIFDYIVISVGVSSLSSIGILWLFYVILRDYDLEQKYTLLSLFFLPIFIMVVPFGMTESISMFVMLCGIYFLSKAEDTRYGILSAIAIVSAYFLRETYIYWVFLFGNLLYMIVKINNRKSVVAYALVGSIYYIVFDWVCRAFFILYDQRFILSPFSGADYVSLVTMLELFVKNFSIGYVVSYGVLGVVILYAVWFYWKNYFGKKYDLLFWNGFLGASMAAVCVLYQSRSNFYNMFRIDTVRQFNISIFIVFMVALIYTYKPKYNKKILSLIIMFYVVSGSIMVFFLPSSLSVTNLSLSYRAPWVKVSNYLRNDSSNILIIGEPIMRLEMFLDMYNPNVVASLPPFDKAYFNIATKFYDKIFVYGEYHYNHLSALKENCPWVLDLVANDTEYVVRIIWDDSESYFMQVIK